MKKGDRSDDRSPSWRALAKREQQHWTLELPRVVVLPLCEL